MQSDRRLDAAVRLAQFDAMKLLAAAAIVLASLCPASTPAWAQSIGPETGKPMPRFASLRFNEVNMRRGAGEDYPIAWKYTRRGLPIEIFQEYKDWRHLRDHDGASGWVHKTQLSGARTALVLDENADIRADPGEDAKVVARAEPGVVLTLISCQVDWCKAKVEGYVGWVSKTGLWGVTTEDFFDAD